MTADYLARTFSDYRDFESGFEEDTKLKSITEQLLQDESSRFIDEYSIKKGEDWSLLANQVVGAEHF